MKGSKHHLRWAIAFAVVSLSGSVVGACAAGGTTEVNRQTAYMGGKRSGVMVVDPHSGAIIDWTQVDGPGMWRPRDEAVSVKNVDGQIYLVGAED